MILIAYDGSDHAAVAASTAASALRPGPAVVMTIWEPFAELMTRTGAGLVPGVVDFERIDAASRSAAADAAAAGAAICTGLGMNAEAEVAERQVSVASTLVERADALGADAIAIGTRGLTGAKSLLLGSVSHAVLREARRPVLVVPTPPPGSSSAPAAVRRVLLCYDGSAASGVAIDRACALLAPAAATVLVTWEGFSEVLARTAAGYYSEAFNIVEIDARSERSAMELASAGADRAASHGVEAEPMARRADISTWRTILEVAREQPSDAIAMGSRGLGAVKALMLGSVSAAVTHHCDRPVLVAPPD
jgi:nucleotide-binding universal stress UspA family protein